MHAQSKMSRKQRQRRGAAVIELAVCLPIIVLLTLATIEACSMLYLRQSLKIAAFEACRIGLVQGATSTNVQAQASLILNSRRVNGAATTTNPPDPRSIVRGDMFTVQVSANCNDNALLRGWFFEGKSMIETVAMVKDN
jgi:Flp pilus assembly protein TadG